MVPKVRFELTRGLPHRFLRPARLPFRHFGLLSVLPGRGGLWLAFWGRLSDLSLVVKPGRLKQTKLATLLSLSRCCRGNIGNY